LNSEKDVVRPESSEREQHMARKAHGKNSTWQEQHMAK